MVVKRFSILLALAAVVAGIVSACGASASTGTAHDSTSTRCIKDRSQHGCGYGPIVENQDFIFSSDGRSAYALLTILPEGGEAQGGIWIYDRDPQTGSIVQKSGTAGCISEGRVEGCQAFRGVGSIALSPDGDNFYATTNKGIALFDRDAKGNLSQKAGAEGVVDLPDTADVAVGRDGKNVYAATSRGLVVFDRDPSTGTLTQKPGSEGLLPLGAGYNVLVSPDGRNVYVNTDGHEIITFDRDPETGSLKPVPGPAGCVSEEGEEDCRPGHEFTIYDLVISPDGHNVYAYGEVSQKVGVVVILDRRPDGTLVQKPGKDGCFGGEGRKHCADPAETGLGELRGISVTPDGKYVYIFEYTFPGEGRPLLRHPSGRLTMAPRE